jgi:thiol-disulfide isomerase/thioredoxin
MNIRPHARNIRPHSRNIPPHAALHVIPTSEATRNLSASSIFDLPRFHRIAARFNTFEMAAFLALSIGCFPSPAQTSPPSELSFTDLSGKSHSLSDYRGKIVLLNFWATWCLPCRDEMPMLSKLSKDFASQDIVFLAVSLDDAKSQSKVLRFLEKKKITLPVFTAATPATLHNFQLGEVVPATIILDRDGSPVFRIMGQASKKDILSRVDWLLSDRSSKSPKSLLKNF